MLDSKQRFSSRADYYTKYRPHYTPELISVLREECGLEPDWTIADVGSGTGLSAELFVANGNLVYGIEPNMEMRAYAEILYKDCPNFISINGSAEDTTLPDGLADMVIAGEAFHWFDKKLAKREFVRISKPGGWIVIFWNRRQPAASQFMTKFTEIMAKYAIPDGSEKQRRVERQQLTDFFAPSPMIIRTTENIQTLDEEGLIGRTLSQSSMPEPSHESYKDMEKELKDLFNKYQENGKVSIIHNTEIFIGRVIK